MCKFCRFEAILKTLPIDPRHESFWLTKTNTCFVNGVFGAKSTKDEPSDSKAVQYVQEKLHCNISNRHYVTIIQRNDRRLLNADEMLKTAQDVFAAERVRIVDLEQLSLKEQVS